MTVEVSVFLFGKPAWEIEGFEGGELNEAMIERIRKKGWEGSGTLYDVSLFKDTLLGEARRELADTGLDPALAFEFEDDDSEAPPPIER